MEKNEKWSSASLCISSNKLSAQEISETLDAVASSSFGLMGVRVKLNHISRDRDKGVGLSYLAVLSSKYAEKHPLFTLRSPFLPPKRGF